MLKTVSCHIFIQMGNLRYKGYYIDKRIYNGFLSRVGINFTYQHSGNSIPLPNGNFMFDEKEERVTFLSRVAPIILPTTKYTKPYD